MRGIPVTQLPAKSIFAGGHLRDPFAKIEVFLQVDLLTYNQQKYDFRSQLLMATAYKTLFRYIKTSPPPFPVPPSPHLLDSSSSTPLSLRLASSP